MREQEVCAVLFFIHLFQAFSHFVEFYLESGKEWIVTVFAAMMFLKARMLVRNVFALVVEFASFVPGVCFRVSGWVSRGCECSGCVLEEERTLKADSCSADPTSLHSARAWGGDFLCFRGYHSG